MATVWNVRSTYVKKSVPLREKNIIIKLFLQCLLIVLGSCKFRKKKIENKVLIWCMEPKEESSMISKSKIDRVETKVSENTTIPWKIFYVSLLLWHRGFFSLFFPYQFYMEWIFIKRNCHFENRLSELGRFINNFFAVQLQKKIIVSITSAFELIET